MSTDTPNAWWTVDPASDPAGYAREVQLGEALADGRIAASSVPQWRRNLQADPEGNAALLAALTPPRRG